MPAEALVHCPRSGHWSQGGGIELNVCPKLDALDLTGGARNGQVAHVDLEVGLGSAALADVLMSIMSGLRVTARAELGEARLASAAKLATSILDHP